MKQNDSLLNDEQRAHLLQLYKSKLQQLGDDKFFEQFDQIREECYKSIGVSLSSLDRIETSQAASQLGKRGGASRSEPKSGSSRENGKKGGRPKKQAILDMSDI